MVWDPSRFFAAFKRAGMLDVATYVPDSGPSVDFDVGFHRPDQVVLDGMVHTTDYFVEYEATAIVLRRGYVVVVGADTFKVRQEPDAQRDGTFFIAYLEKTA